MDKCLTFLFRFMSHDPQVYPDPSKFNPERFLGPQPQKDPRDISFGFGRRYDLFFFQVPFPRLLISNYHRVCPGQSGQINIQKKLFLYSPVIFTTGRILADSSIFISCAMSLAVFDITKYSKDGIVVEPVVEQTTGTIR